MTSQFKPRGAVVRSSNSTVKKEAGKNVVTVRPIASTELLPEVLGQRFQDHALVMGLDLGTKTGYSAAFVPMIRPLRIERLTIYQGQFDLSLGAFDTRGIIAITLRAFLNKALPALLFYEDVKYTPPEGMQRMSASAVMARAANTVEFFGGLKMVISEWGEVTNTPCRGIPIGTIKKRATGLGNAGKPAMVQAHNALFGTDFPANDTDPEGYTNIVDSAYALLVGLEEYVEGLQ